jgi:hypothetical protein
MPSRLLDTRSPRPWFTAGPLTVKSMTPNVGFPLRGREVTALARGRPTDEVPPALTSSELLRALRRQDRQPHLSGGTLLVVANGGAAGPQMPGSPETGWRQQQQRPAQ